MSLSASPSPLQWGHGDEAVEERRAKVLRTSASRLQWGHGDEAVEEGQGPFADWSEISLQWGHGDEAVEEGPPPGPFGAKDLGPVLREGRSEGVSNRSRARAMKS